MDWQAEEFADDLLEHLSARTMAGLPHVGVIGPKPDEEAEASSGVDIEEDEISSREINDEGDDDDDIEWKFVPNRVSYHLTTSPIGGILDITKINFFIRLREGCDEDVGARPIERGRLPQYVLTRDQLESAFRQYEIEITSYKANSESSPQIKVNEKAKDISDFNVVLSGRDAEILIVDESEPFLNFDQGKAYLVKQEYRILIKKTIVEEDGKFTVSVTVMNESPRTKRSTLPLRMIIPTGNGKGHLESEEECRQRIGAKNKGEFKRSPHWDGWRPPFKCEGERDNPEGNRYGFLMEFSAQEEISCKNYPIGEKDLARTTNLVFDDSSFDKNSENYSGKITYKDHVTFHENVPQMKPGLSPQELFEKIGMSKDFAGVLTNIGYKRLHKFQEDAIMTIHEKQSLGDCQSVLISARTAGGKTEAFSIPIINFCVENQELGTKALIFYPTKALANDQASRIIRILYHLNKHLQGKKITLGILHGDISRSGKGSEIEEDSKSGLPFECPKCGNGLLEPVSPERLVCDNKQCNESIDFVYVYDRKTIYAKVPDIVITNPDTMIWDLMTRPYNHSILGRPVFSCNNCNKTHIPKSFKRKCDECRMTDIGEIRPTPPRFVVFDEVHLFKGSFGINCSFFISRLESIIKKYAKIHHGKDSHSILKIGSTATISNAKDFGMDFFNSDEKKIHIVPQSEEIRNSYYVFNEFDKGIKRQHVYIMPYAYNTDSTVGMTIHYLQAKAKNGKPPTSLRENEGSLDRYLQMLTFVNSIRSSNSLIAQTSRTVSGTLPDLQVSGHTTDFDKRQRSQVERKFNKQELQVVFATQTLEVGVDFGRIDVVLINGFPYSFNDYLQRIGRGGRKADSLVVTVCQNWKPIDHYYFVNAKNALTEQKTYIEPIPLTRDNIEAAKKHLCGSFLDGMMALDDANDFVEHFRDVSGIDRYRDALNDYALNAIAVPQYYEEEIMPYLDEFVNRLKSRAENYNITSDSISLMTEFRENIDPDYQLSKLRSTDQEVNVEVFWSK